MFDTYITIVGNVLTSPEWRRTTNTNALVANFKVASTSRRLDRDTGRWIDGYSLRVRVNCWRRLAEGVASSLMVGDPVMVVGRLYTRDWTDESRQHRVTYELEAIAVGHDLSRGRAKFYRARPVAGTSAMEGAEDEARVNGELAEQVPPGQVPASYGDGIPDDPDDFDALTGSSAGYDPMGALSLGNETVFPPKPRFGAEVPFDGDSAHGGDPAFGDEPEWSVPQSALTAEGSRDPVDDDGEADNGEPVDPQDPDGVASPRRTRRRTRTPVPA